MNVCGTATVWAKIALVLIVIALVLHVVGFATDFWQQTETIQEVTVYDMGLWNAQNCSGGYNTACDKVSIPNSFINTSFKAVRGLESIVLICIFITVVVASFYVATERFRERSIAVFIAVMCFLSVTFAIISMIVWLAQLPENYYVGYSFGLCVVAFVLMFLAGILMIPDIRNHLQNRGAQRIKPAPPLTPTPRASKYDDVRRGDYSYNRKFTPDTPNSYVRHYYNPNREAYIRSPPPTYKTKATPEFDRYSTATRTEIQTPDVYLGRDGRKPRRF